ncbi:MAG: glycerate kinase [Cytophagaceae bacterium]|nr:glycerate kinase [Cytophagaceae bacterium]
MKILVAPDSFKESLSATEAAQSILRAIKKVIPEAQVILKPVADGGEGTVEALVAGCGGSFVKTFVHDPFMRPVEGIYGIIPAHNLAVIEVASASGLHLLKKEERNPLVATSYGTGEMIQDALEKGCKKILIGLGGSATNDGGAGIMQALGIKFLDSSDNEIGKGGGALSALQKIDVSGKNKKIIDVEIIVACDVKIPLTGDRGTSCIYSYQKGATSQMAKLLDDNLKHYADIIKKDLDMEVDEVEGAGAAGGIGAGLMAFLGAKLTPGFPLIAGLLNLESEMKDADLVITGEGKTDAQTLSGKAPLGVAQLGKKYNVPVVLFAGKIEKGAELLYKQGIISMIQVSPDSVSIEESMNNAAVFLESSVENYLKTMT